MVVHVVSEIDENGVPNWTGVHENMDTAIRQFNHIISEIGSVWTIQNPSLCDNKQVVMFATASDGWTASISKVVLT